MAAISKAFKKPEEKKTANEKWKLLKFDFDSTNKRVVEVSNLGRVRSINSSNKINYLKGTDIKGYRIIKLKFFSPRVEEKDLALEKNKLKILRQEKKYSKLLKSGKKSFAHKQILKNLKKEIAINKIVRKNLLKKDELTRTTNYSKLVHRMVAENFCKIKSPQHSIVTHLDFDKLNNKAENLKWVTQKQSTQLQRNNPTIIQSRINRIGKRPLNSKVYKLNTRDVMGIKKKLLKGKLIAHLAVEYGVTQTQILRIKRGENWVNIPAAK